MTILTTKVTLPRKFRVKHCSRILPQRSVSLVWRELNEKNQRCIDPDVLFSASKHDLHIKPFIKVFILAADSIAMNTGSSSCLAYGFPIPISPVHLSDKKIFFVLFRWIIQQIDISFHTACQNDSRLFTNSRCTEVNFRWKCFM